LGSKDGFGTYHTWSHDGVAGAIDFTVVNYNLAPQVNMDYSIINWSGTGDCVVQEVDAEYHGVVDPGVNDLGTFTLASDEFMEIHEFQIGAAAVDLPVTVSVQPVSGSADLDIRLFGGEQDFANKLSALASATSAGPNDTETLGPVTFDTSDFQAVVVHRKNADDLGTTKEYRLIVLVDTSVGVSAEDDAPATISLAPPRPNPTSGRTQIWFDIPAGGMEAHVAVYDVRGRQVKVLAEGSQPAGRHSVVWDGRIDSGQQVGAGIYFVRMMAGEFRSTRKIIMMR
jgi:hypothetical protein